MRKSGVKAPGSTGEGHRILRVLSVGEESGTLGGAVKCVDIKRNAGGESTLWPTTDAEARKPGEQTGLDTPVVLALNDGY